MSLFYISPNCGGFKLSALERITEHNVPKIHISIKCTNANAGI